LVFVLSLSSRPIYSNLFSLLVQFLKKSLRIERVAEEVKLVLKPHYNKKHISKEEYKEILRKAVPKVSTSLVPFDVAVH
jgi:hypothetical protein